MKTKVEIPMYDLVEETGNPTDFEILLWGKKDQNYDAELPHRHNFNEVLIFFEGGGTHEIDFNVFEAKSHTIHFVANNNVHLLLRDKKRSSGCSLLFSNDYFLQFNKNFEPLKNLPFSSKKPFLLLRDEDFKETVTMLELIYKEYFAKKSAYRSIIQNYMNVLMLNWCRIYDEETPENKDKRKYSVLMENFINLTSENYTKHLSIEQYAFELGVTANHLSETCSRELGQSPLQMVQNRLIAEAKRELFYTKLSIKEIAYKLGFSDPAYFTRFFKKHTNYSPLEYRGGIIQ